MNHIEAMELALEEARGAVEHGDVPVGAVMLDPEGNVVATAHNRKEERNDPTAHAELLAIQRAANQAGEWRLDGYTLVVTLEPCPMCAMAAVWARVGKIVFRAADLKTGGAWSLFNIPQDKRLNHHIELEHGILAEECARLLEEFFSNQR